MPVPEQRAGRHPAEGVRPGIRHVRVWPWRLLAAYQRQSSKAFWTLPVLLSIAHGGALSPQFEEGLYNAVSKYARTRSPNAFADALESAVYNANIPQI